MYVFIEQKTSKKQPFLVNIRIRHYAFMIRRAIDKMFNWIAVLIYSIFLLTKFNFFCANKKQTNERALCREMSIFLDVISRNCLCLLKSILARSFFNFGFSVNISRKPKYFSRKSKYFYQKPKRFS